MRLYDYVENESELIVTHHPRKPKLKKLVHFWHAAGSPEGGAARTLTPQTAHFEVLPTICAWAEGDNIDKVIVPLEVKLN